jgi:hypothetical protein
MKRVVLLLFVLFSFSVKAQPLFSVPLEKKNPKEQTLFVDQSGYSVVILKYPTLIELYLFKDGIGKVGEFAMKTFLSPDGYTSDAEEFTIYLTAKKDEQALSFNKVTGKAIMRKRLIKDFPAKEKILVSFTREDKFYQVFKNDKLDYFAFYEFSGAEGKLFAKVQVPQRYLNRQVGVWYKFIPENKNVADFVDLVGGKIYWRGDSLCFTFHESKITTNKKEQVYVWFNLKRQTVSERRLDTGKAFNVAELLLGDKIFFFSVHQFSGKGTFDNMIDSLKIEIWDANSFKLVKRMDESSKGDIRWKATPYLSTEGDTIENKWKDEKAGRKMLADLRGTSFIHVMKTFDNQYSVILGTQIYHTHTHGGFGSPMVTTTTLGPQHYFRATFSENLEPAIGQVDPNAYDLAARKRWNLSHEKYVIQGLGGVDRYTDTKMVGNDSFVYLLYVDRKDKILYVERF